MTINATTLQTIEQVLSQPEIIADLSGLVNDLKSPTGNEATDFYAGAVSMAQIAEGFSALIGKSFPYIGGALDIASLGANSLKAANEINTLGYIKAETAVSTAGDLLGLAGNIALAAASAAALGVVALPVGALAQRGQSHLTF